MHLNIYNNLLNPNFVCRSFIGDVKNVIPVLYITKAAPVNRQLTSTKHNFAFIFSIPKYVFDIKIRIKYF